jgi:hypothetical protein
VKIKEALGRRVSVELVNDDLVVAPLYRGVLRGVDRNALVLEEAVGPFGPVAGQFRLPREVVKRVTVTERTTSG